MLTTVHYHLLILLAELGLAMNTVFSVLETISLKVDN